VTFLVKNFDFFFLFRKVWAILKCFADHMECFGRALVNHEAYFEPASLKTNIFSSCQWHG